MDAKLKFQKLVDEFGIEAINMCIKRHDISNEKRSFWSIQYQLYKEDSVKNKTKIEQLKAEIDILSKKIEEFDQNLLMYGINSRNRPSIIKTIKESHPDDWFMGFVKS